MIDHLRVFVGMLCGGQMVVTGLCLYHYNHIVKSGHKGIGFKVATTMMVSWAFADAYIAFDMTSHIGTPLSWRLPIAITGIVLGMPALLAMLNFSFKRDRELNREKHNH